MRGGFRHMACRTKEGLSTFRPVKTFSTIVAISERFAPNSRGSLNCLIRGSGSRGAEGVGEIGINARPFGGIPDFGAVCVPGSRVCLKSGEVDMYHEFVESRGTIREVSMPPVPYSRAEEIAEEVVAGDFFK